MKIAVLIDSFKLPSWKSKIIEDLYNNESTEVYLIELKYSPIQKLFNFLKKFNCILFYLYESLDYLVFSKSNKFKEIKDQKDALQKINIKNPKYKTIKIEFRKNKLLCIHNCSHKKELDFDLIVDLTKTLTKDFYENFIALSKKGICFFELGEQSDSFVHFFKEIYFNIPTINVCLSITDGKYKKTLYESCSETFNISFYLNSNKNLWKISNFIKRKIDKINDFSLSDFNSNDKCFRYDIKVPSNGLMLKFISKILKNILKTKLLNSKFKSQWFLAYEKTNPEIDLIHEDKSNFKIIAPPDDKFFADPFIVNENNKSYVFFEEYCYLKQKGMISYLEIDENEKISSPQVILEKDYHISYPFVYKHENKYYMIPETLANKTIELYEATDFPEKWELKKVLFDNINAVDSSLVFYNQKFWLFTNVSTRGAALADELFIFYSESLLGEWQAHSKNPVVSNSKTARSAGKFFFNKGRLIRPSQESSLRYGYALNFNNVDILTENDYQETLIKNIKPEFIDDNLAIHTFNSNNIYNFIDGMRLIKK